MAFFDDQLGEMTASKSDKSQKSVDFTWLERPQLSQNLDCLLKIQLWDVRAIARLLVAL